MPADDYFLDLYQTAIEPGELLVAFHIPVVRPGHRWAFDELARRRGDYALVGAGILANIKGGLIGEARIAFFSVGSTPVRAKATEAVLLGARLDNEIIAQAQAALAGDLDPPDDEHVPAAMRQHLARVLLGRLLGRLMEKA